MDQEFSIYQSSSKHAIQNEPFHSRNSSFTKLNKYKDQLVNISNKSSQTIKSQGTEDLLKKLSGSDPAKIIQQLDGSKKSSSQLNQFNFLHNSKQNQDKTKLGSLKLELEEKYSQIQSSQEITHSCDCKIFGKNMYCPKYCVCYNKPQRCSKIKCCSDCFQVKEMRLKAILQQTQKRYLQNPKGTQVDVGIYIQGAKKAPRKFREEKCQCRNSRCQNKYCVCFTAGKKCSVKCLCQNCKNSDFIYDSQDSMMSNYKNLKPYLQGGSNESLSEKMQFQPPYLPF